MKNIHILPTDKPSRLIFDKEDNIYLPIQDKPVFMKYQDVIENQHLYITSDEIIKDVRPYKGKWQLEKGQILNKFPSYLTDLSECKLVILSTDPQLIKDGVQAIDSEFLEWFVKNPSCERVEIKSESSRKHGLWKPEFYPKIYKATIPTKRHSFCETPKENCTMNYCDENGCINRKRNVVSENLRLRDDAITDQKPPEKVYSKRDMLDFAWFLFKNIGVYSDDRLAHFEGEYLESFEKTRDNGN